MKCSLATACSLYLLFALLLLFSCIFLDFLQSLKKKRTYFDSSLHRERE